MVLQALIYPHPASAAGPTWLERACREAQLEVELALQLPSLEAFGAALPQSPRVIFLPALEEDCLGVKLAQLCVMQPCAHQVHLYAEALPGPAYMAMALREGVGEVLAAASEPEVIERQLRRAVREAREAWSDRERAARQGAEVELLRADLERSLERQRHLEERCVALAQVACRLATGELLLRSQPPGLLVVSASEARTECAQQVAARLGFEVSHADAGAAALEQLGLLAPSVILCDGELPDMDARAFAVRARAELGRRHVSIVVWSSSPDAEARFLTPGSGLDGLVHKSNNAELELGAALLASLS